LYISIDPPFTDDRKMTEEDISNMKEFIALLDELEITPEFMANEVRRDELLRKLN
jgi:hypothetical protein